MQRTASAVARWQKTMDESLIRFRSPPSFSSSHSFSRGCKTSAGENAADGVRRSPLAKNYG
ncbi:MAG: hypothetical protein EPN37_16370 [Chitinophagaceae bacterium]|nr:MAG: hypothetical protein EPN37_16370 [Chitinophagaceae bacterium]